MNGVVKENTSLDLAIIEFFDSQPRLFEIRCHLLALFENLAFHDLIIRAGACGDRQAAVRPELPFRAKTLRRADDGEQLRDTHRTKTGQLHQNRIVRVLASLRYHLLFRLFPQLGERGDLIRQRSRSKARGFVEEFSQPFRALLYRSIRERNRRVVRLLF